MSGKLGAPPASGDPLDPSNPHGFCERKLFVEDPDGCVTDLYSYVYWYTVLKPFYEIGLQVLIPWFKRKMELRRLNRRVKKASEAGPSAPAPPPGTTAEMRSEAEELLHRRAEVGKQIEEQTVMPRFNGTVDEYTTKVTQFGYVCLFASAFPAASLAAVVANFVELRIDAHKIGYLMQRPPYRGAEDIGSWQSVLSTLAWLALVVNVLLVCYSSNLVRDNLVVPWLAVSGDDCSVEEGQQSWEAECTPNWLECYASIGGSPDYPAWRYLPPNLTVSIPFIDALCGTRNELSGFGLNDLYNLEHCFACEARQRDVSHRILWLAVVCEHALILLKMAIAFLVPDKPRWVEIEQSKQRYHEKRVHKKLSPVVLAESTV